MPLTFHPGPGTIVICDFTTGFRPPEMVKKRPVVIISPRRRASSLAAVVPLSSTPPEPVEPWHWPVPAGLYPPARGAMWGKADMVLTVALNRLDRVSMRDEGRKRTYRTFVLTPEQLRQLHAAVKAGLGLS